MGKINLGYVDHFEAYEFRDVLWLLGRGTNPTPGWKSWFQPVKIRRSVFEFMQEAPEGAVIGLLTPFKVLNAFQSHGEEEVAIRKLVSGKPVVEMISVRKASPVAADAFSQLWPPNAPEDLPPSFVAAEDAGNDPLQVLGLIARIQPCVELRDVSPGDERAKSRSERAVFLFARWKMEVS